MTAPSRTALPSLLTSLAVALLWPGPAAAAPTLLNFEDQPARTRVTAEYGARGVIFPNGAFVDSDAAARSPSRVLRAGNPTGEFHPGPMVIDFTSAQQVVRMYAGTTLFRTETVSGTLKAFNSAGTVVAQDGPKPVAPARYTTLFQVSVATQAITRVTFEMESTEFEAIDDLEFDGAPAEQPPSTAPVVQITAPPNDAPLDLGTYTFQGTVTGASLLSLATLVLERGLPPGSTAPPSNNALTLSGTGTSRTFSFPYGLGLGPYTATFKATNTGGLQGSATVRFTVLPAAIRTRFTADGGATTYGALRYGVVDGGCNIAVYERGAIAAEGTATRSVRGAVFTKWTSVTDPASYYPRLGCPMAEERAAVGNHRAQEFRRGRVYTGPLGSSYVPTVFANASDQLGGEAANGIPIGDPQSSIGVMQTWLFQRLSRPGRPNLQPSTFEIRGTPPTLYVERQGGELTEFTFPGLQLTDAQLPTLWLNFPCSSTQGPCTVTPPTSAPPLADPGNAICQGTTHPWGPREWQAVTGDQVTTPMLGIIKVSDFANEDDPLSHECHLDEAHVWASDWRTYVRPLHPYKNLFGKNSDTIEIEIEHCLTMHFFVAYGYPFRGELIFTAGRWIVDCGHDSYNSEIHPPSVYVLMHTEPYSTRPATIANLWVNGFYTGDPVDLDIYPPPRPSPEAVLNVAKPRDSDAALDVQLAFTFMGPRARVRFTAPRRTLSVDSWTGEMLWQTGRGYEGRWYVYWTDR